MYFPILRGKQYEMLALRSVASTIAGSSVIHPIIEPIQFKSSNITKAASELIKNKIPYTIIINPTVGDVKGDIDWISGNLITNNQYSSLGIIVEKNTNLEQISNEITRLDLIDFPIQLILKSDINNKLQNIIDFINTHNVNNILVNQLLLRNRSLENALRQLDVDLIYLIDSFHKRSANAKYLEHEDEFFTEEHLYFRENGYIGFSDYVTIGEVFTDGGFAPYAVAIHLTYLNRNSIRIHHFVSDSNDDITDTPGKFLEALNKLIPFVLENNIDSRAIEQFKILHEEERYPNLGSVKKLSIIHHIELIYAILIN
ncbi:sce7725 family protein [Aquimarina algiphila]|uniref:Sce7725 family protein n=1 Tax=Aquimarina algiphila TaxID=2047982 RepID=A0A554VAG0_9FLAO|nr:sce7725 family protein [Aquimarina algiphila]TSE03045.1 sce7725 family protein [Aquimarina algiphila]